MIQEVQRIQRAVLTKWEEMIKCFPKTEEMSFQIQRDHTMSGMIN